MHKKKIHKYTRSVEQGKVERFRCKVVEFDDVTIHVIPFLPDNLAYLIVDKLTMTGVLVDPADPHEVTVSKEGPLVCMCIAVVAFSMAVAVQSNPVA